MTQLDSTSWIYNKFFDCTKAAVRPVLYLTQYYYTRFETLNKIRECAFRFFAGSKLNPAEKDTSLNGSNELFTLPSLAKDIRRFIRLSSLSEREIKTLNQAIGHIEEANRIYFEIAAAALNNALHSTWYGDPALALDLNKKIDALEIGSHLLIPGGCVNTRENHKVLYEIVREGKDLYRFTVFNTGKGAFLDKKNHAYPLSFLASKNAVGEVRFWQNLVHFSIGKSEESLIEEVYKCIQDHFKKHDAEWEFLTKHPIQNWGSCAFEPYLVWLKSFLPKDLYRQLHQLMLQEARNELESLLPIAKKNGLLKPDTIDLINRTSAKALLNEQPTSDFFQSGQGR